MAAKLREQLIQETHRLLRLGSPRHVMVEVASEIDAASAGYSISRWAMRRAT